MYRKISLSNWSFKIWVMMPWKEAAALITQNGMARSPHRCFAYVVVTGTVIGYMYW
jgi:hypothetical protein